MDKERLSIGLSEEGDLLDFKRIKEITRSDTNTKALRHIINFYKSNSPLWMSSFGDGRSLDI